MKFYFIDTIGEVDGERVLLDLAVDGMEFAYQRMCFGTPASDVFPPDATMRMTEDNPGIKLESLLGNTQSYLIVASDVKKVIEEACANAEVEYLPFTLINHKGRVHSTDYFIINPIGTYDCLNHDASDITYFEMPGDPYDGSVVSVNRFVIDPAKAAAAPALFRLKEEPTEYVINEDLANAIRAKGFTNFELTEIEQLPSPIAQS